MVAAPRRDMSVASIRARAAVDFKVPGGCIFDARAAALSLARRTAAANACGGERRFKHTPMNEQRKRTAVTVLVPNEAAPVIPPSHVGGRVVVVVVSSRCEAG